MSLTAVAASETIVTVTEENHSLSPFAWYMSDRCHFSSS